MKNKITIIHFLPLEFYPPVMNLLNYLSKANSEFDITVFTTKTNSPLNTYNNNDIEIIRYSSIDPKSNKIIKFIRYLRFYVSSFLKIVGLKPSTVIYFETLSALPGLCYKKINKNLDIYAHYHEIVTFKELKDGRILEKYINGIEKKNYSKYKWISQTNETRLQIFKKQYGLKQELFNLKTLPNYPPQSWVEHPKLDKKNDATIKLLYIGSLSLTGIYLREVLNRFGSDPLYTIDFYSYHFSSDVKNALAPHQNCHIRGAINYNEILKLKGMYDIGLVLYKGLTINFKYNAPNKLFEYLALDLDVWCSDKLITAKKYKRLDCYPKVIMVDYENLPTFDAKKAICQIGLKYKASPYVCETVYNKLLKKINENNYS